MANHRVPLYLGFAGLMLGVSIISTWTVATVLAAAGCGGWIASAWREARESAWRR